MFILNFSFLLYSFLFFVLFLFLGLGLTILFCPKEWLKYTLFLSPILGYCLLSLAGWYFYSFNFKGTDSYYYWILLISFLFLVAAFIKVWKQNILKQLFSRELIIPVLIAICVFLIVSVPLLRQERLTSMTLFNNDIADYSLASKIVQELPKDVLPQNGAYYSIKDPNLGGYFNTAFFCSVVKLEPYQVQDISLIVFFIISLFLVYILGRKVFKYSEFTSNSVVLLYGLNSILFFLIFQGFVNQIIAMSLMLLTMLSNVAVIRAGKFKAAIVFLPVTFLALWGLLLTYSHMLVIIYGIVFCYVLISCWKYKKITTLLNWMAINCIAILVIFAIAPQQLQIFISNTITMSSTSAGWFLPLTTPQKLYGIIPFLNPSNMIVTIIVTFFFVLVIVAGFVKLFKSDMENFLFSSITFLLVAIGTLALCFLNTTKTIGGEFGGYNQFKLVSFFVPLVLLISFTLFRDTSFSLSKFNIKNSLRYARKFSLNSMTKNITTLYLLIIAALVIANAISASMMISKVNKDVMIIPSDIVNLQVIRNNPDIKSINIPSYHSGNNPNWTIMWEAYFLFPDKLFFEQKTYGQRYYSATPSSLDGEWWLVRTPEKAEKVLLASSRNGSSILLPINTTYSLRKIDTRLNVNFGVGWSSSEGDFRWTISDTASVIVDSVAENMTVNLTLKCAPLNKENRLSIYLNSVKIMEQDNKINCELKDLSLKKGKNIIEFKAKMPGELPGNGDRRKLCYSFQTIKIDEAQ
jgi:hypothetical protein